MASTADQPVVLAACFERVPKVHNLGLFPLTACVVEQHVCLLHGRETVPQVALSIYNNAARHYLFIYKYDMIIMVMIMTMIVVITTTYI